MSNWFSGRTHPGREWNPHREASLWNQFYKNAYEGRFLYLARASVNDKNQLVTPFISCDSSLPFFPKHKIEKVVVPKMHEEMKKHLGREMKDGDVIGNIKFKKTSNNEWFALPVDFDEVIVPPLCGSIENEKYARDDDYYYMPRSPRSVLISMYYHNELDVLRDSQNQKKQVDYLGTKEFDTRAQQIIILDGMREFYSNNYDPNKGSDPFRQGKTLVYRYPRK